MKTQLLFLLIPIALISCTSVTREMGASSMQPTISRGESIKIVKSDALDRKDIVAFDYKHPTMEATWVFRVAGLPGDTVEIRKGALYVNGKRVEEPYAQLLEAVRDSGIQQAEILGSTAQNAWNTDNYGPLVLPKKGDKIPGDQRILTERNAAIGVKDGVVAEDLYFVLGDNRHDAYDSRYIGLIPASTIVGEVPEN